VKSDLEGSKWKYESNWATKKVMCMFPSAFPLARWHTAFYIYNNKGYTSTSAIND